LISLIQEHATKLDTYAQMVEDTVDMAELARHNYVLLPTLDNSLQTLREDLEEVRDALNDEHKRVGEDLGIDIEKKLHLENHQVYKYSLRITKAVRSRLTALTSGSRINTEQTGIHRPCHAEVRLYLYHYYSQRPQREILAAARRLRAETTAFGQRSGINSRCVL
jgi:hypothetical protein